VIAIERPNLSEAWTATLEAVVAAGGTAVNVITTWHGAAEIPAVRALVDEFIRTRPAGKKDWPRWPVTTVANTIFAEELYDETLGRDALGGFVELYLEGREFGRRVSPTGEYCERLVDWEGADGERINQLAAVADRLVKYADPTSTYRFSSDYELAVEHPVLDLRIQMPGRNGGAIGFPCLSHISLTVDHGVVHLTALYRNQHLIRKAYGNYVGLSHLGRALCHHAGLELGTITVVATHADSEIGSAAGFGRNEIIALRDNARAVLDSVVDAGSGRTTATELRDHANVLASSLVAGTAAAVGVDAVDVKDFETDLAGDDATLADWFHHSELEECDGDMERLAARFAAKEATLKALGTGIRGVDLTDVTIDTAANGAPSIRLSDRARAVARSRGLDEFRCSFTHEAGFAIAIVIATPTTTSHEEPT
jgi:phosphopantetheine--protein transferase-like protein